MKITTKGQVTIPVEVHEIVEQLRGKATTKLTTDQILALTRGPDPALPHGKRSSNIPPDREV